MTQRIQKDDLATHNTNKKSLIFWETTAIFLTSNPPNIIMTKTLLALTLDEKENNNMVKNVGRRLGQIFLK